MSKPRSDSWLRNLSAERQEQVIEWCLTPKSETCVGGYKHAREQLAADGIKVSLGTLSDFYSWYQLQQTFQQADTLAKDMEEVLTRKFPDVDPAKISEAGQLIFTLQAANARNQGAFVEMERLRLDKETAATKGRQEEKKLSLAERRMVLLEDNAAKAKEKLEKVLAASKGGLTSDTLKQIEEAAKLL